MLFLKVDRDQLAKVNSYPGFTALLSQLLAAFLLQMSSRTGGPGCRVEGAALIHGRRPTNDPAQVHDDDAAVASITGQGR